MEKTALSIEEYYQSLTVLDRPVIEQLVQLLQEIDPNIPYTVWQGIFWGGSEQTILGFIDTENIAANKNVVPWFLIGIAKQKSYYSIYVNAVKDRQSLAKLYKERLGKVKVGSSNISFSHIEQVNLDELKSLFTEAIALHRSSISKN